MEDLIYTPPLGPLVILHADDDILVLDKPSGLLHVPGVDPRLSDCLQSRVMAEYPEASTIHRLDMDTSGVIVMARSKRAHAFIATQFEARETEKIYIARVWGDVSGDEGLIDQPLCINPDAKPRHHIDYENGKPAQTLWRVLEREGAATRLELKPLTGRTHQLRVHMLSTGHPILGDTLYAKGEALKAASRLQLHAQSLSFRHPADGQMRIFMSECPF